METEIQARINALSSPVSPKDILKNAVESKGLGLDLSNLETIINDAILLVDGTTTEEDLIALNAARIAIESNVVTSTSPIKSVQRGIINSISIGGNGYSDISIAAVDMTKTKVNLWGADTQGNAIIPVPILQTSTSFRIYNGTYSQQDFRLSWEVVEYV